MQKIYTIEPIEALKMSIQSEREMQRFYQKAAELVVDQNARSILEGLASHAEGHRNRAVSMYSTFTGKKVLFLNLDKRHKLNSLQRCGDDPNEAVRVAKRNEKEISDFYAMVSRRFLDAGLRAFFRKLAADHLQHLALLESSFLEPLALNQPEEKEEEDHQNVSQNEQASY